MDARRREDGIRRDHESGHISKRPTLETGRLLLRPLSEADVAAVHRVSNEPLVRRYLWDDEPVPRAKIKELVVQSERMFSEEGLGLFGVRLRGSEELVGFCGFIRLEGMEEPELGYELLPQVWGRGLATEAALACIGYAFEVAGLERVIAGADAPNAASLRVMEKLGMKPIGSLNPRVPEDPYYALYRKAFFAPGAPTGLAREQEKGKSS
jgi:ribosomal-protein-alanine N-acetyltransferase